MICFVFKYLTRSWNKRICW